MKYSIWQLPLSNKNCFRGIELKSNDIKIDDYVHVYNGNIDKNEIPENLEYIFELLNIDHPADYHARSLSVSDIVCCVIDGNREWYYVDTIGFYKLEEKEIM